MADDDAVKEAPYCVVCRRSSAVKWRKHVFSHSHQKAAQQFLLLQVKRLQTLCDVAPCDSLVHWRCVFCDFTADALTHFGSKSHRKQVEGFCRHHRCDVDGRLRSQLWLQAAQLTTALNQSKASEDEEPKDTTKVEVKDTRSERVEAFLSSAASRLREVQEDAMDKTSTMAMTASREEQEALLGPLLGPARCCKTVISSDGVVQNPIGRHEGERVWGGGIVKLRSTEWIPWAIDQLVKEEQLDTQQLETEGTAYTHRMTEVAQGEGLSSIAAVSWGASVGNVHTAAVPPWMVETEEEYKKCNWRKETTTSSIVATGVPHKAEKKRRDIFSELQANSKYDQDWLPNFGGVWQEGPRSKTKQAFRKAAKALNSQEWQPKSSRLPAPVQAPSQRVSPAISQESQVPSTRQDSAAGVQQQTPISLSSHSLDGKNTIKSPLDAKKQLLLAQKERLRAKMAAKRRP